MLAVVVSLLLVACGGDSGHVGWRGLELTLPEGWVVAEHQPNVLTVADAPRGASPGQLGERTVSVQFLHRPGAAADDWRRLVEEQEGTLEVDERTMIGDRPAIRFVLTREVNGAPTREMVVLVPARELEILLQPVARPGDADLSQVFLDNRDEFEELLGSIRFGPPVDRP